MTNPDTTTMSGAEFQRHVGTDAEKWAEAFVAAYDRDACYEMRRDARASWVAPWFRDYAEARVAEEMGRVTARLVPRHDD